MRNWKRTVSVLLYMAMLLCNIPAVSFASEPDGLCEHHAEHLECGYVLGESACSYVCEICAQIVEETIEPKVIVETTGTEATQEITELEVTEETAEPDTQIRLDTVGTGAAVQSAPDVGLPENEELFAYFAEQELYGYGMSAYGVAARKNLTDIEQAIYDVLKAEIEVVAASGGSTVFTVSDINGLKTTWINTELGVSGIDDGALVDTAFRNQFNLDNIITALLNDCPFDLYWYDKTVGATMDYQIGVSGYDDGTNVVWDTATVENLSFVFAVSADYKSGDYAVTSDVAKITVAKNNAALVVADNAGKSDYEKLVAYKDYICAAVSYDQSAADGTTTPYGNPWQMISVFDGDSETNVVCEGYSKAFRYLCDLSTFADGIALPSTLTSIGANAFEECKSLHSPIRIPEGVTTLEENVFFRCEKLEKVYLPSTLRSIENGAFQFSGITSLEIPDKVEIIGDAAFYGCSKLQSLDLGNGVKHIGAAFFVCSIPSLHLPASVETIDTTLWHTSMMAEVTVDADNPYYTAVDGILYNKNMTEIIFCPPQWTGELVIPDTVQSLADGVFAGCGSITSITIPDSVTSFGTNIFEGCGVHTVVLPDGMEAIPDSMFNQCISLVSVELPDSIKSIGAGAFRSCAFLETLHIPEGVSYIGDEAFAGCRTLQLSVDAGSPYYLGAGEYTTEDMYGNVTTLSSVLWLSYRAEQCPGHDWIMSQCLHDCGEGGDIEYTCFICQETRTETVAPSEHSLHETITAATCTEDAYITRDCTICEYICAEYLADALGHSYGEWFTAMEPNCTWNGERWRECSYCGYNEIEILPAHGHNYESCVTVPTCTEKGYTTHTCSVCGDTYTDSEKAALGHDVGEWEIIEDATCAEDGSKRRECSRCNHVETDIIDATNHDHKAVVTAPTCTEDGYTTHTCQCGDSHVDSYVDAIGHNFEDGTCSNCGEREVTQIPGDIDGNEGVDVDDVLALLWNVLFPEDYPVNAAADFDGNGTVDVDDVLALLWHVLFPEDYPLN